MKIGKVIPTIKATIVEMEQYKLAKPVKNSLKSSLLSDSEKATRLSIEQKTYSKQPSIAKTTNYNLRLFLYTLLPICLAKLYRKKILAILFTKKNKTLQRIKYNKIIIIEPELRMKFLSVIPKASNIKLRAFVSLNLKR